MNCGILIRPWSLWVGIHYAPFNRRTCVNLLPCITIWVVESGGEVPIPSRSDVGRTDA